MAIYSLRPQQRRQHTIIQLSNFASLFAASWQRQALCAYLRDAGVQAERELWLARSAEVLLERVALLKQAQLRGDVLVIDLDDACSSITWQSRVLMGDDDSSYEQSLVEAMQEGDYVASAAKAGVKRDVELARRLVSVLASDQLYDSVIVLGVYHPIVRRVRLLRERCLVQNYDPRSLASPLFSPGEQSAWLMREAKRRSKSWSISLECAQLLVAKDLRAAGIDAV